MAGRIKRWLTNVGCVAVVALIGLHLLGTVRGPDVAEDYPELLLAADDGDQTFGGYECTVDCSGHQAGYLWAARRGITDESECEDILARAPGRTSFYEGCMVYVADPARGAEMDDDDDEIDPH